MLKRTITGACLVAAVVGFFFLRKIDTALFMILVAALTVLGTAELLRAFGDRLITVQKAIVFAFSAFFVPTYFFFELIGVLVLYVLTCLMLFAVLVVCHKVLTLEGLGLSLIAAVYPELFLLPMLIANGMGQASLVALVLIFIISPASDTMAYLVGITFKGKKLCPELSPKKTVSGAIGGIIGGVIGSVAVFFIMRQNIPLNAVSGGLCFAVIGFIGSILTEFGDLAESVIKRKLGIKDMGKILPGHGGILDRIDGILYACPFVCAAVFAVFALA